MQAWCIAPVQQTIPLLTDLSAGTVRLGDRRRVRRLGLGAMQLCGPGAWGVPPRRDRAIAVLRFAVTSGVQLIDTADAYGPSVNEELIAEALAPYPADVLIATKGGRTRAGPRSWSRDGRPAHLRRACEGSLRRLRLDCIDLYQLHAPDPGVPFEESVGALARLREEGKVRHVGLSNVSVAQLEEALAIVPVASVQNRLNLGDRSSQEVLSACERLELLFIAWHPLTHGLTADARRTLSEVASRHGVAPAQVSIAWLLARSPVTLPIPGTASTAHLAENLAAARVTLGADDLLALDALA